MKNSNQLKWVRWIEKINEWIKLIVDVLNEDKTNKKKNARNDVNRGMLTHVNH